MNFNVRKGLCYLLALVMVADPTVLQRRVAWAQEKAEPAKKETAAEPTPEDLKRMADEMERAFKALEAAEKEIPRDTFDPKAIVDKVGRDPVKLFEWVRDNTYWVPYRGALRGPTGVLMDRLGNSLDRSLLLAELLRTAGHKVRLVRGELTEEQSKQLLARVRSVPREPLPRPTVASKKETDSLIEKFAKEYKFDPAAIQKNIEVSLLQSAKNAEGAVERMEEQMSMILKAVGKPDENMVNARRDRDAVSQLEAMRDHWWVQRQDVKASTDLDPLLPDAQAGSSHGTQKQIFEPSAKTGDLRLDSEYCHEVRIKFVIEQWTTDGLQESIALIHTLRPAELFGARITVQHIPMHWPKDLDLFNEKEPLKKLKSTVLAENEWMPVLTVGTERFVQSSFTDTGETIASPLAPLLGGGAQGLGGNIGGILGGGRIGQAPGRGSKKDTHLTAEWIEYEIQSPGQPVQKIRRQVFDLLGPAVRSGKKAPEPAANEARRLERALNLLGETDILLEPCRFSPDFVEHAVLETALMFRTALPSVLRGGMQTDPKSLGRLHENTVRASPPLYLLARMRHGLSRKGRQSYLACTNVLAFHKYSLTDASGNLFLSGSFDIVSNRVAVHRDAEAEPFLVRLEQGIMDTCVEALFSEGAERVDNAAEITSRALARGISLVVVRSITEQALTQLKLPSDALARIKEEVAAGNVVYVPTLPVPTNGSAATAWWSIDPRTGSTLGIGDRGWGQTSTEQALVLTVIVVVEVYVIYVAYVSCAGPNPGAISTSDDIRCRLCAFVSGFCAALAVYGLLTTFGGYGAPNAFQIVAVGVGGGVAPTSGAPRVGPTMAGICSAFGVMKATLPGMCKASAPKP
jgi:hypothetical protein